MYILYYLLTIFIIKCKLFNANWELDEKLKAWLINTDEGLHTGKICSVNRKTTGGKKDLINHGNTKKHLEQSREFKPTEAART